MAFSKKAPAEGSWGKFIPAKSPWLRWSGRVDFNDHEARFDWAQVSVFSDFESDACAIYLDPVDNNFNVFMDGALKAIIGTHPKDPQLENYALWATPSRNQVRIWVLKNLGPGRHHLEINKRTGANFNVARFYGLRLSGTGLPIKPAPAFKRRLEFIGDSLTNAYGCEASKKECTDLRSCENSWKSYAAQSARALEAEIQILALSGYGVVRNYGDENKTSSKPMPHHYGNVISGEDGIKWDRKKYKPDAIVINLGSNDHSTEPVPDENTFLDGYMGLLDQALAGRKKTPVFLISVKDRPVQVQRIKKVAALAKSKGMNVQLVSFEKAGEDELGCDWHPKAIVHERWAKTLTKALKQRLGW